MPDMEEFKEEEIEDITVADAGDSAKPNMKETSNERSHNRKSEGSK